ncbi:MAG: hypothetical protein ACRD0K_02595 [Egibacteraceae bacterium]
MGTGSMITARNAEQRMAAQALAELVVEFGLDRLEDPNKLRALLADRLGGAAVRCRSEIDMIVETAKADMPRRLSGPTALIGDPPIASLVASGFSPATSTWVMQAWAAALALSGQALVAGAPAEPLATDAGQRWPRKARVMVRVLAAMLTGAVLLAVMLFAEAARLRAPAGQILALPDTVYGSIDQLDETDAYDLALTSADVVRIALNSTDGTLDPVLRVYTSRGALVAQNDDTNDTDSFLEIAPGPGEYVVEARGYGGSTGPYRLSTAPVPPPVRASSDPPR